MNAPATEPAAFHFAPPQPHPLPKPSQQTARGVAPALRMPQTAVTVQQPTFTPQPWVRAANCGPFVKGLSPWHRLVDREARVPLL